MSEKKSYLFSTDWIVRITTKKVDKNQNKQSYY